MNTSVPEVVVPLVNDPVRVPLVVKMVHVCPMLPEVNTRPFTIAAVRVPPKLVLPLTLSAL